MKPKTYISTVCFLLFLPVSFLFASGSWQGEVSLSDNSVPVDCSLTATIINLQYTPSDPEIKQELDDGKATINYEYVWTFSPGGQIESGQGTPSCTGKFTTVSSAVNDKTVSVNVTAEVIYLEDSSVVDSDSNNFSANLTVFTISLSANPETICAGGDDLDICKSEITASIIPALEGISVAFTIFGNKGYDGIEDETFYDVSASNGNLSNGNGITDENGEVKVYLTSSSDASNPDTQLYFYAGINCFCEGFKQDSLWVKYDPPNNNLNIFLDPQTEQPLEYLIADGQSQAENVLHVSYSSTNISNHAINWKFKFWTISTLDQASQNKYSEDFEELTSTQQNDIIDTTTPDYEGTNSSDYGSITANSTTNSSGIATSTYTAGIKGGYIEFCAKDNDVNLAKRGSMFFQPIWIRNWFGKGRLKLRVYIEDPPQEFIKADVKNDLKDCFNFISDSRFEWVDTKFTTCNDNEYNILYHTQVANPGEMGFYEGRTKCWVYYDNIVTVYSTERNERAGRVGAHEMGHSYTAWHHVDGIMIGNIADLPAGCNHFCSSCQNEWNKILGGGLLP